MQFGSSQAYMEGDHVAILQQNLAPAEFTYSDGELAPATPAAGFVDRAAGLANWSWQSYRNESYRLEQDTAVAAADTGLNPA